MGSVKSEVNHPILKFTSDTRKKEKAISSESDSFHTKAFSILYTPPC